MFVVRRSVHNPILMPVREHHWEAHAAFNWCTVSDKENEGLTHAVYRAMSFPELLGKEKIHVSTIGHAVSTDGEHYTERRQIIKPEHDWEKFGCEDPRTTFFDGKYYILYTALSGYPFSAETIKVAVATTKDFKTIDEKHLVTPFNAKAAALFPEKINGKFAVVLTANTDKPPSHISFALFDKEEDMWNSEFWSQWYGNVETHSIDPRRMHGDHVEVGAPPILTKDGWLLVYSHIQKYFSGHSRVFGVEALLLDKKDPKKILGRSNGPILVPESLYEKNGNVPNIVFPTGALVRGENLEIFYGSADTTSCMASVNLENFVGSLRPETRAKKVRRFEGNPIIVPKKENKWEEFATFNPAAIELEGNTHILYRAMSNEGVSTIGYAVSKDGLHIDERSPEPIYTPREDFEIKGTPGNSGTEDPRVVELEDKLYMFYTAYNGVDAPRVAVSSIDTAKFLARDFDWSKPTVITPPGIMDKDASLIPEKIGGKYILLHRISDVICIDVLDTIDFRNQKVSKCIQLIKPRHGMWDGRKVGIASPPIKTDDGWILLYHGVSDDSVYSVGAVLLDRDDPSILIARTTAPILEPEMDYEKEGQVPNVVFPCGSVKRGDTIYIYYGGGDSVVGVATADVSDIVSALRK